MKALILRLLSVLFFTSFCSVLLWHYLMQSPAGLQRPRNVGELDNSAAAARAPLNIKGNNPYRKVIIRVVKKRQGKSNDVAVRVPFKVKQNPAKSNDAAASNLGKVKPNPAKSNDVAAGKLGKVKQNPAKSNDAAANDPGNVQQNPAKSNDVAANDPGNVQQNPAKSNDVAVNDPDNVKQNPENSNNTAPISRRRVRIRRVKNNDVAASGPENVKQNPAESNNAAAKEKVPEINQSEIIANLLANYTSIWTKQEKNLISFRSLLSDSSDAISNATVSQENSPVGKTFTFDGDPKRSLEVTPALFNLFPKESPFKTAPWDSCAVVGNGGILANSSCGKQIDSASFVIRCNLPPLSNGHERDTGNKTDLVTANPSILVEKYHALNEHRRSFVENIQIYGDALLFLPAFSFHRNTAVSLRALYTMEDFNSHGPRPVFFNPEYLSNLAKFWHDQGIHSLRLSTGIMVASLALELCNNVHLYGFWPFGIHPYTQQPLSNHYYDDRPVNKRMHAMPAEFEALLNLHNKGIIRLHLDECEH
ncbi:alpha-N-acetylneuraminide alpha-2,8-sialyltransferase-like isoform X4 [Hemibagrus wyckioides]|uniref:alpha-N-acetylneuraminide alpha-2,8-sialyltransferase-like isoform X3 n=1 Tax=Hemibagrus wyckioides TaxID=337641 RepID=UPI00266CDD6E|nr:alpha-N-acetylneuraminide alpha-2,8-sialyltransferase-like isoform X3 [Hemibagrus wyckioides]XP_058269413.1 alpha-N-acetylneuraminide alpha-2,8-sialyltransferase-like isoform X4 [Hemibagrus wyckioides]